MSDYMDWFKEDLITKIHRLEHELGDAAAECDAIRAEHAAERSALHAKLASDHARVVELEARLDGADVDNITTIAKNLNEMRLMEENAKLRAALQAANEDAERLATNETTGFFHSSHYCIHCGMGYEWGDPVQEIQHAVNCPITLHRARVGAKLEGGESVMDSPDKEAKGS